MKIKKITLACLAALTLLALAFAPVAAQNNKVVDAQVDRTTITADESVILTVTVQTSIGAPSKPSLPALSGFTITGQSSGMRTQIINGVISTQTTYQFRLQPMQIGDLTIEPISVDVGGQRHQTDPITVKVGPGQSSNPAPKQPASPSVAPAQLNGQDLFVEAIVDNPTPYQGQQITHTFRIYRGVDYLLDPEYQQPAFSGFWSGDPHGSGEVLIEAAGRYYQVSDIQTVLIPAAAGEVTIDPSAMTIPGGFFSRGASAQTNPVPVEVRPLPGGAPASFAGAVGQFELTAEVNTLEIQAEETVTVQLTISGAGNLETMGDPRWAESESWRSFDTESETITSIENGRMVGARVYQRDLLPTEGGSLIIPGIEYSYFDPEAEDYKTLTTEAVTVNVVGDVSSPDPMAANPAPVDSESNRLESALAGMRPLKPAPASWRTENLTLTENPVFWLIWLVPLVILVGQVVWYFWQRKRFESEPERLRSGALKRAKQQLNRAEKSSQHPFADAGVILSEYLETKLGLKITGLTQTALLEVLLAQGVDRELAEKVQRTLMLSELGQYAPSGIDSNEEILSQTRSLVEELDLYL